MKTIKKTPFILIIIVLVLSLSLISITYAWIARRFSPEINGTDMSIESTGALMVTFTNAQAASESVDLHELIEVEDFTFKQLSSENGRDFYYVNFDDDLSANPIVRYIDQNSLLTADVQTLGLLRFRFAITLANDYTGTRYVFFHPTTGISEESSSTVDYSKAFRMSFTFEEGNTTRTMIFSEDGGTYTEALAAEALNKEVEIDDNPSSSTYGKITAIDNSFIYSNQVTSKFSDYLGGYEAGDTASWVDDSTNLDTSKVLFTMNSSNAIVWVDCCIWLEGSDANTVVEINSLLLDLLIKFDSIAVNS